MTGDGTQALVETHVRRGYGLLAAIDEHLERGITDTSPAHLARGAELEARLEEHLALRQEFMLTTCREDDTWRFAMRRDNLRNERALGEISQTLARRTHELVRYFVDEGDAHRVALRRVVERFDGAAGSVTAPSYRG